MEKDDSTDMDDKHDSNHDEDCITRSEQDVGGSSEERLEVSAQPGGVQLRLVT